MSTPTLRHGAAFALGSAGFALVHIALAIATAVGERTRERSVE